MERENSKVSLWQQLLGFAVAIGTIMAYILGLTAQAVTLRNDVESVKTNTQKHEVRLQAIEASHAEVRQDMREMKSDIGWIRKFLERRP